MCATCPTTFFKSGSGRGSKNGEMGVGCMNVAWYVSVSSVAKFECIVGASGSMHVGNIM